MNSSEMKQRAKNFLTNEGIAERLLAAYFEMGSWPSTSQNYSSYGVTDIENENFRVKQSLGWLTSAKILDIRFKIGGYNYSEQSPGPDYWVYYRIFLYLNDKLVISARYEDMGKAGWERDCKLYDVEEFHNVADTKIVLWEIERIINDRAVRREEFNKLETEKKYIGKFDF